MMEMQKKISGLGGTMRLGAYPMQADKGYKGCSVSTTGRRSLKGTVTAMNSTTSIMDVYEKAGMIPVGINEKDNLVEIMELKDHPWFIGVQFHPEYKSTVANPHPLFVSICQSCHGICKVKKMITG